MIEYRIMDISDYDSVFHLFSRTPGVTVREADSYEATARYLNRNPDLSFVALSDGNIVGCIFGGHDGRRGYLQHLVVAPDFRSNGIARGLVDHCLKALDKIGIKKTHVEVLLTNSSAQNFWANIGWQKRNDIYRYSFINSENPEV